MKTVQAEKSSDDVIRKIFRFCSFTCKEWIYIKELKRKHVVNAVLYFIKVRIDHIVDSLAMQVKNIVGSMDVMNIYLK